MTQTKTTDFFGLRGHVQLHIPAASHFGLSGKRSLQLVGTLVASFLHPRILVTSQSHPKEKTTKTRHPSRILAKGPSQKKKNVCPKFSSSVVTAD